MNHPILFLHIGMPKSASTYLADSVFPALMPGRYIAPGAANAKQAIYRFRRNRFGVRRFSDAFHKNSSFWVHFGNEFLAQFLSLAGPPGRPRESVLITEEAITRLNHFQIRNMPSAFRAEEIERNFEHLQKAAQNFGFGQVKVLLITRRQDRLLAASYAQLSRKMIAPSQRDFERKVKRLLRENCGAARMTFFSVEYCKLYSVLARSVGGENTFILPVEMIDRNFDEFMDKMASFLDVTTGKQLVANQRVNSRSQGGDRWALRPMLLFKSLSGKSTITLRWPAASRDRTIQLTPDLSQRVMAHFGSSNKRLEEAVGSDLSRFGYC